MIKTAILEYEKETKDIVFLLGQFFSDTDWCFRHFYKASDLARTMKNESYQIFFFDEMFKTPRLESVFVHDNPGAMIVYICHDPVLTRGSDRRSRVHYVSKTGLAHDLLLMEKDFKRMIAQKEVYTLTYQGARIDLPIEDIYWLEKNGKNVYFHTRMGEFHRRLNLSDLEETFEAAGFLRVHNSFLVNEKYMTGVYRDEVELCHQYRVPLSRAQKKKLGLRIRRSNSSEKTEFRFQE